MFVVPVLCRLIVYKKFAPLGVAVTDPDAEVSAFAELVPSAATAAANKTPARVNFINIKIVLPCCPIEILKWP